jgi:protein-tyrosine phosphatase
MTTTVEPTRHLRLPGTFNVREAGGYPIADGGRLRTGLLIRADGLAALEDAGRQTLAELGVRTVIDLREDSEVEAAPDALGDLPIEHLRIPAFAGLPAGRYPTDLTDTYHLLVDECGDELAAVVGALARPGALPAIVHCTAGKDRTGVVIALVHALLGVSAADIEADYAATAAYLSTGFVDRIRAAMPPGHLTDAMLTAALACPPELIRATLARIDEKAGGVENYLLGHGLSAEDIKALRTALVER